MKFIIRILLLSQALFFSIGIAQAAQEQTSPCLSWRWIGVMANPEIQCENIDVQGWTSASLFAVEGVSTPPGLRNFCRFESAGTNPSEQPLRNLLGKTLTRLDMDCAVVSAHADPTALAEIQWAHLAARTVTQAGADELARVTKLGLSPVRLAILDSNPTNESDPERDLGRSPHGNALITLAEQLLCTGTMHCPVRITSQLALRFLRVDATRRRPADFDSIQGGYLGSVAELAVAINREVSEWRAQAAGDRLIINLSLGWDAAFGGGETLVADMPATVQAMHAALTDASCRDVLVMAAAGNRTGGIDPESGPTLPGLWETRAAPDYSTCLRALGTGATLSPRTFTGSDYRPLVHAVSGIQDDGTPLDNIREGANARLAAFGDHATAESLARPGSQPTAALSGSSVSSLLASTNAALAWSWKNALSAHEVVDLIHAAAARTSSALGRTADFCLIDPTSGSCQGRASAESHRLSLCLTRVALGSTTLTTADCVWTPDPTGADLNYAGFDRRADPVDLTTLVDSASPAECAGAVVKYVKGIGLPDHPCPHLSLPSLGARPWVLPQPGSDLCPHCGETGLAEEQVVRQQKATSGNELRLEISPRLNGQITGVVLVVGNTLFDLSQGAILVAGDQLLVRGLDRIGRADEPSFLAFAVNGEISAISTILRIP